MEQHDQDSLVRMRLSVWNRRLADSRREKGWNQREFGRRVGVSWMTIHRIETLKTIPSQDLQIKMAIALEKDLDYLFPEGIIQAVKFDVFGKRVVEIGELKVISLTEAKKAGLLPSPPQPDEIVNEIMMREAIEGSLKTLTSRERRVIELRFGLDGNGSHTLEEVGREFKLTRERISQIERKAMWRLRHPSRSRVLKDFLD